MRAKRTEWRMRGIEPNKNVTSFSPHPSCLRYASATHLPARSIAGPLWLKTVTCGLFLRCFTPSRRAPPRGEGLIGCVVILSVSNAVIAISRINQTNTLSFRGVSREIPCGRKRNKRTRIPPNPCQRRLCAPRWLAAEKYSVVETMTPEHG